MAVTASDRAYHLAAAGDATPRGVEVLAISLRHGSTGATTVVISDVDDNDLFEIGFPDSGAGPVLGSTRVIEFAKPWKADNGIKYQSGGLTRITVFIA